MKLFIITLFFLVAAAVGLERHLTQNCVQLPAEEWKIVMGAVSEYKNLSTDSATRLNFKIAKQLK